jgi:hypothetical protein
VSCFSASPPTPTRLFLSCLTFLFFLLSPFISFYIFPFFVLLSGKVIHLASEGCLYLLSSSSLSTVQTAYYKLDIVLRRIHINQALRPRDCTRLLDYLESPDTKSPVFLTQGLQESRMPARSLY